MKNKSFSIVFFIFLTATFGQERKQIEVNSYPIEFERKIGAKDRLFGGAPVKSFPQLEVGTGGQVPNEVTDYSIKRRGENKLVLPHLESSQFSNGNVDTEAKKYQGRFGSLKKDLDELEKISRHGGSPSSDLVAHLFVLLLLLIIFIFYLVSQSREKNRKKEISKVRVDTNELMRLSEQELIEEIAQYVSINPARINVKNYLGWTALMFAAVLNKKKSIEALVSLGADVSLKNYAGLTAYDLAAEYGMVEIAKYLEPLNLMD